MVPVLCTVRYVLYHITQFTRGITRLSGATPQQNSVPFVARGWFAHGLGVAAVVHSRMLGDDGVTKLAVAKVVVTRIAGCVGLLSALAVICETYDSRAAKDRILFWLQAGSLTIPIVSLLGPWPAPRNTQGLWGARGTQTTCTLQGLAFHLGATPLAVWDVFLSISFVLTIKYNWSEEQLRKAIRIAHYFVWPISVFRAGILLFYDLYNPSVMGIYCAVALAPPDCMETGQPCQRGSERHMVSNTYISTFCFVVVIIVSTCCMTMITLHIRRVEHRGARHRFSHIAATLQRRDGENGGCGLVEQLRGCWHWR